MKTRSIAAAVSAAALTAAAPARADMGPKWDEALFLPIGVNIGAVIHPALRPGFLIGGEVSLAYINKGFFWTGGFADALGDPFNKAFRYCVGPEVGWGPFGLDTGYLGELRAGAYHNGLGLRVHLTLPIVGLYGRWGHIFDDPQEQNFGEVGVLVKLPIPLWQKMPEHLHIAPPPPEPPAPPPAPPPPVPQGPVQKLPEPPSPPRDFATPPRAARDLGAKSPS